MKRNLFLVFLVSVLLLSLVTANEPTYGDVGQEDVEKIQNLTEKIPIDPDTGEFDYNRLSLNKSKAEERIEAINSWLEENASWLNMIFGMTPEISWTFAITCYLMLFFIAVLIIKGECIFLMLDSTKARIVGLLIYIIMVVMKLFVAMARPIYRIFDFLWNYVLAFSIWISTILIMVIIVLLILLIIFVPRSLGFFYQWFKMRQNKKREEQDKLNSEILKRTVEPLTED